MAKKIAEEDFEESEEMYDEYEDSETDEETDDADTYEETEETDSDEDSDPDEESDWEDGSGESDDEEFSQKETGRKNKKNDVKYYTSEEVSRMVRKRVNSKNIKIKNLKADSELIDDLCDLTGLDRTTLKGRLDSLPVETKASLMKVPVSEVQNKTLMSKQSRELAARERKMELKAQEAELKADKKYSDFDEYKDEIYDTVEEYPNMSLKQAYVLVKSENGGFEQLERTVEQRVMAQKAAQKKKSIVKGNGIVTHAKATTISPEVREISEMMGISPQEYMRYSKITSLGQLDKMSKNKKKG